MADKPVASYVPWEQVCKMLEKVQTASRDTKKSMLTKFMNEYRLLLTKNSTKNPTSTDSFFPALRILLPALDRDRGAYGVKESKLALLYIRILGLKKESSDAQKLINFRKPKAGSSGVGDFAEVAYYVLKHRCPDKSSMSLHDVNVQLTSLAENYASKEHDKVEMTLLQMLRSMTAMDQKWLIRVLLKEMHLGVGQNVIFNTWHPDAKDYYDVCNSLLKVSSTLKDPSTRLHEIDISLFTPFRPMLAERAVLDKVEKQMNHKTFYVETKYDGERSQIHKNGRQYKYFSRNGFDFTSNFGSSPSEGLFTPYVHRLFRPHVNNVILDGEMIGWSEKHKTIISKGEHMDVKNLREDGDWQVCFCVFDILYLNDEVLSNLPLKQRLSKISSVITPTEGRVIIGSRSEVTSCEEVVAALNEAIDNREEGVVLKDPDSVYRPASRKAGWIKVKPDYVDSLVPELDLLIVGGYYGKGRRQRVISHFLLAVLETSEDKPDKETSILHDVTKVGSGYTVAELEDMLARLKPHMTRRQPRNLIVKREKPDVWITPDKSCVVQVKASELVKTDKYNTGITLRFPRVETVRTDKSWHDILDTKELQQLFQESSGKIATKHMIDAEESSPNKKRAIQRSDVLSLPPHFRPADTSKIVKIADLFADMELCVVDGDDYHTKEQLETMICKHGGSVTQHPSKKTHCIISDIKSVRVKNYITTGVYNVIRPCWVSNCITNNKLLSWGPLDVIHVLEEEEEKMTRLFDEYGNSYSDTIDVRRLKQIMDNMSGQTCRSLSVEEKKELDELLCDPDDLRGLFRLINAVFIDGTLNVLPHMETTINALKFRLHGGVISKEMGTNVTHLIVPQKVKCQLKASDVKGRHLITWKWIDECIERGKLQEERHFIPKVEA